MQGYLEIGTCCNKKLRAKSTKRDAPFLNIFVSVCVSVLGLGRRHERGQDRWAGGCLDARRHVAVPLVETAQHLIAHTYLYYVQFMEAKYVYKRRKWKCIFFFFLYRSRKQAREQNIKLFLFPVHSSEYVN